MPESIDSIPEFSRGDRLTADAVNALLRAAKRGGIDKKQSGWSSEELAAHSGANTPLAATVNLVCDEDLEPYSVFTLTGDGTSDTLYGPSNPQSCIAIKPTASNAHAGTVWASEQHASVGPTVRRQRPPSDEVE